MKQQALYHFHQHFVYRTPASPLQAVPPDLPAFFEHTKGALFREAIYLASPVLYDELVKWHNGLLNDKKDESRLITSLYKYYQRMQSRCTPYGLFAGCGTGAWAASGSTTQEGRMTRHTRLDMHYLCSLAQQLNQHEAIASKLRYFPNNSTYLSGGQLRYVEYKYLQNRRVHQISSVEYSDYLKLVIDGAGQGATIDTLKQLLVSDEISDAEALGFIRELIDSQLLVSELEPAVTGDEFIHQVIGTLKSLDPQGQNDEIAFIVKMLNEVQEQLAAIDRHTGNAVEHYRAVFDKLKQLSPSVEENNLFQTDLYKADGCISLDSGLQAQLSDAIGFLNRFNRKEEQPLLKSFRERFYEQYESAEVPLLEALDTETGIGYTGKDTAGVNALIDDLYLPAPQAASADMAWGDRQAMLHRRLLQAVKDNEYAVVFTDEDAGEEEKQPLNLPDTLPLMFRVAGDRLLLQSCGGASAAGLLGRFAHGSAAIHQIIGDITAHEELLNPGKILAEIVHLPESRVGNILLRPVLRKYELPYLGKSALPKENQVCLQDIRVSVQNNRIVLRSVLHDKEVIPRLSTAHNYVNNALPVYQFLGDMQKQYFDKHRFEFSWGAIGNHFKFLPRAEYKGVILKRARWSLDKSDFSLLLNEPGPGYMQKVHEWRTQLRMPQRVVLSDFDNELLVDLNDPMSLGAFAGAIKKRPSIILEEFLFDPQNLLIKDTSQNGYTNEFIAILLKQSPQTVPPVTLRKVPTALPAQTTRSFGPGSEWLYYKVYGGIKTTDKLLPSVIKPLAEEMISQGWADQFFFIRYADPQTHLRLRFHVPGRQKLGAAMAMVHDAFASCLSDGSVSRLQMDTYHRELERYGSSSIGLAESFFHIDSTTTLGLLDMIDGSEGEQIRWQFALRSIDELLDGFGYDAGGKLQLMEKLRNGFVEEHGGSKELKIQLDTKFRNLRALAENILNRDLDGTREIFPLIELLRSKQLLLLPITEALFGLKHDGHLQQDLDSLMESFVHMMMNRIFPAKQRTYEMVIYDVLHRCYKSAEARGRQQLKVKKTAVS